MARPPGFDLVQPDYVCAICRDPIWSYERCQTLDCQASHRFHASCIEPWCKSNHSCPTCRSCALCGRLAPAGGNPSSCPCQKSFQPRWSIEDEEEYEDFNLRARLDKLEHFFSTVGSLKETIEQVKHMSTELEQALKESDYTTKYQSLKAIDEAIFPLEMLSEKQQRLDILNKIRTWINEESHLPSNFEKNDVQKLHAADGVLAELLLANLQSKGFMKRIIWPCLNDELGFRLRDALKTSWRNKGITTLDHLVNYIFDQIKEAEQDVQKSIASQGKEDSENETYNKVRRWFFDDR